MFDGTEVCFYKKMFYSGSLINDGLLWIVGCAGYGEPCGTKPKGRGGQSDFTDNA